MKRMYYFGGVRLILLLITIIWFKYKAKAADGCAVHR